MPATKKRKTSSGSKEADAKDPGKAAEEAKSEGTTVARSPGKSPAKQKSNLKVGEPVTFEPEDSWSFVMVGDRRVKDKKGKPDGPDKYAVEAERQGFEAIVTSSFVTSRPDDDGDSVPQWQDRIKELRRKRPPYPRGLLDPSEKADTAKLLRMIRKALKGGSTSITKADNENWLQLTMPRIRIFDREIKEAVNALHMHELEELTVGCSSRYVAHPRERLFAAKWIHTVLEQRCSGLLGKETLKKALQPLLKVLAQRVGPSTRSNKVLACLGKWKLVSALCDGRLQQDVTEGGDADEDEHAAEDADRA